jgi:flagellar biosynthetic protein FliQ
MTDALLIQILQDFSKTVCLIAGPLLGAVIAIGLLVNIFQTVTQMRDQALTFVPKAFVVAVIMMVASPWYLQLIRDFTEGIFDLISQGGAL